MLQIFKAQIRRKMLKQYVLEMGLRVAVLPQNFKHLFMVFTTIKNNKGQSHLVIAIFHQKLKNKEDFNEFGLQGINLLKMWVGKKSS